MAWGGFECLGTKPDKIGSTELIASMDNSPMMLPAISLVVVNVSLVLIINEFFACTSILIGLQCLSFSYRMRWVSSTKPTPFFNDCLPK